jgi:nicotinate-nucleotide adenylyltransferase
MIGIFGGTFDPIHFGHLRPAFEVNLALGLEALYFVPANVPPHRPPPMASAEQRLLMVELALTEFPQFVLDDREIMRGGISYTTDTLQSYRDQYSDKSIVLLMGADAFSGIETWHRWQSIPELAHIVVMRRPGWDQVNIPDWAASRATDSIEDLQDSSAGLVYFQSVDPQPFSATAIRAALAKGESVEGMLPQPVLDFVTHKRIYAGKD